MTTGKEIRRFRREREWSQGYLARRIGVSQAVLSRVEKDSPEASAEMKQQVIQSIARIAEESEPIAA